jgi:hypothetical protein
LKIARGNSGFFIVDANPNAHFVSDHDPAGAQQGIFVSFKKGTPSKKFSLAICAVCKSSHLLIEIAQSLDNRRYCYLQNSRTP